ncbi:hypothetical protein ACFWXK_22525 [Streptomyces sp. NPDC059070]|uniref:hypothetical protein n=1 Tax=Streptomyces sp. NPDC059070 TaxID=3346713 RepID=UPI0036A3C808
MRKPAGSCFGIAVHRLIHGLQPSPVPASLSRAYGAFAPRAGFGELRAAVEVLGRTVELDDTSRGMDRYRVPRPAPAAI